MLKRILYLVGTMLALAAAPAFAQTAVTVDNLTCNNSTIGVGGRCNDAAQIAINNQLGSNWANNNPGATVVVRFTQSNNQVTYTVTVAGTLSPQTSCVTPSTNFWQSVWDYFFGSISESTEGVDFNGDSDMSDSFDYDIGEYEGDPCGGGVFSPDDCLVSGGGGS